MENREIDVIIPVYRPDEKLHRLLLALEAQTVKPSRILLVNTEEALFDPRCLEGTRGVQVVHIRKSEFDHGGTRHMAAGLLQGAFLLFLTQDAVPADEHLIEELLRPFEEAGEESCGGERPQVCAAYARQLPAKDCNVLERYTRSFNYGKESRIKTAADLPELGIKTFFCSNVCAMYRRSAYEELGGFERRTIFNEDMIFAGHAVEAGYQIAYAADAQVIHSHNYTAMQQLHRNFDLGVSQADHPEVFGRLHSEGEGIRLVKKTAKWLVENGHVLLLPQLVMASGSKYAGYWLGKHYKKLPDGLIRSLTMNPAYWEGEAGDGR